MYEKRKSVVQASLDFLFYARRTSNSHHERYSYSLLGPGTLTAHRRFCLVLLHSCPDTVHRVLLRKTQTSTSLIEGSFAGKSPRIGITPAVADCRYRAPLSPRLRMVQYTRFCKECQGIFRCRRKDVKYIFFLAFHGKHGTLKKENMWL